tara:strand:+ start:127 stop:384 length:258 start_codon:yes stop_codon:yes gene_type:complete
MAQNTKPCQVNSGTSISAPGTSTDGFGVKTTRNIYIVAATANFTANGVACIIATNGSVNFGNNPLLVTGAVSSIAVAGTVFYYIE